MGKPLIIEVIVDGKKAKAGLKDVDEGLEKVNKRAQGFTSSGMAMMATSAVLGAGLYKTAKAAADLEQAVGGTEAVFKDSSGAIDDFADSSAELVGLSESAARSLTTRLGGALQGLGYSSQEAAGQAVNLTKVAADLAATYGGTTAEAVEALGSALRGEFDPAEQFNLFLKQSTVDAKAVEMGLAATTTQVDANARAQATLALVMEQSADAQGQFARESDSAAGAMAVANAQFEDAQAQLGTSLLPVMSKAAGALGSLSEGFTGLDRASGGAVSTVVALGVAATGATGAVSFLVGQIGKAKERIGDLREATQSWTGTKSAIAGIGMTVGSVAAVAATLWTELNKINEAAEKMGKSFTETGKQKALEGGLKRLQPQLDEMDRQMAKLRGNIDAWNQTDNPIEKMMGAMETDALAKLHNEISQSKADLEKFRDEVKRVATEQQLSEETAIAYVMGIKKTGGAADEAAGRSAALKSLTDELAGSFDRASSALKGWVDELHGTQNAQADAERAVRELIDAQAENQLSTSVSTEAGYDNLQLIQDLQSAALAYGAEIARETGSVDAATAATQQYIANAQASLIARYGNTGAVQGLNAAIALTPDQVHTAFSQSGLDEIIDKTKEFSRLVSQQIAGKVQGLGFSLLASISGNRADGGPVSAGGAYNFMERGMPEVVTVGGRSLLFMPPGQSGTVSAGRVAEPGRSGGEGRAGGTYILQLPDGRELARWTAEQIVVREGVYG